MAVPSSGTLSMYNLAREKHHDDYSSNQNILIPISMYDLVNGGNTNGSGVSYDVTTQASSSKPDATAPHAMSEWYSYDHDTISITVYESSWSPSGTNWYTNGSDDIGHATKAAACSSTNTINSCYAISWTGTLGNGTTLYFMHGNSCVLNTVLDANNRYIKMGNYGGGIGSNCATAYPGGTVGNVMKVSDSGVVSEFASSCVTLTGLDVTSTTYPKPVFACGQTDTTTRYFSDTVANITVNSTVVYTTSAGTTTLSAGNYGLNLLHSSTNNRFTVNSSGVITVYNSC